eukprot:11211877-Lingulodinium_polyedra.AAC.1
MPLNGHANGSPASPACGHSMANQWPLSHGHSVASQWPRNGQSMVILPRPLFCHTMFTQWLRDGLPWIFSGHSSVAMQWPFNVHLLLASE